MTQTNMNCVSTPTHTHTSGVRHTHTQEMGRKLKGISMSFEANHKKKHLKKKYEHTHITIKIKA